VEVAAAEQEVVERLAEDVEVVQRVVRRPLLYVILLILEEVLDLTNLRNPTVTVVSSSLAGRRTCW
jgi:hypothetical protein